MKGFLVAACPTCAWFYTWLKPCEPSYPLRSTLHCQRSNMRTHCHKYLRNTSSIIMLFFQYNLTPHDYHHFMFVFLSPNTKLMSLRACSDSPPAAQPNRAEPIRELQQGCWEPLQYNLIASGVISSLAKRRRGLTWWLPIDLHSSVIALVPWISL